MNISEFPNVAAGKNASQSSDDSVLSQAGLALDILPASCTQTLKEAVPYWMVDLLQPYRVDSIRIMFGEMRKFFLLFHTFIIAQFI